VTRGRFPAKGFGFTRMLQITAQGIGPCGLGKRGDESLGSRRNKKFSTRWMSKIFPSDEKFCFMKLDY